MPVQNLHALEWSYAHDLNAPPARFSVKFLESDNSQSLKSLFLPSEAQSTKGLQSVNIDVTVNGATIRLMTGVVRFWGVDETPNQVFSTAEGIDLKGTVLDFHPPSPDTYRGMELLSDAQAPIPVGAVTTLKLGSDSVGSDIKAAFFETFQSVARKVVQKIGYTAYFDCQDYYLGRDVVWEIDRTAMDVLAELTTPYNITEQFKMDISVEGSVVRFVERGRSTPTAVSMNYGEFSRRRVRKFKPAGVNDVQVLGATYRYPEPNIGAISEGQAFPQGYTTQYRIVLKETPDVPPVQQFSPPVKVGEITGTRTFDKNGRILQHTRVYRRTTYFAHQGLKKVGTLLIDTGTRGIGQQFPADIREETIETYSYVFPGPHSEPADYVKTIYITDNTQIFRWDEVADNFKTPGPANAVSQYIGRTEAHQVFDANGDVSMRVEREFAAEVPHWDRNPGTDTSGKPEVAPDIVGPVNPAGADKPAYPGQYPTALQLLKETLQEFFWASGTRWRMTTIRQFSPFNSVTPTNVSVQTEPATGRGKPGPVLFTSFDQFDGTQGTWQAGAISVYQPSVALHAEGSKRMGYGQVKAGPDNAQMKILLPTLGSPSDAEYFRAKKKTELSKHRYEVDLQGVPNLNVKEAYQLTVLGAPARWQTNSFFLVARSMRHVPNEMGMTLKGLAWLDT